MNPKFLRTHLLALLGYTVLVQLYALTDQNNASIMVLIMMVVCVGLHTSVLVLGALVLLLSGKKEQAGQWLLAALLVGVIGFSACWGGASLAGNMNFH